LSKSPHPRDRPWVALDVGGVLFSDGANVFINSLPAPAQTRARALIRSPSAMALRRGQIDEATFWKAADGHLPTGWTARAFREAWYTAYEPNEEIFDWIERLHRRISLAIFSGNVFSRVDFLEARRPFRRYFDKEVWSFEHGATKPEPAFARALLTVLDTSPERVFYVDDKLAPLQVAEGLGVNGFLYREGDVATLKGRFAEFYSHLLEP